MDSGRSPILMYTQNSKTGSGKVDPARGKAVLSMAHVKKACNRNRVFVGVGSPNPY